MVWSSLYSDKRMSWFAIPISFEFSFERLLLNRLKSYMIENLDIWINRHIESVLLNYCLLNWGCKLDYKGDLTVRNINKKTIISRHMFCRVHTYLIISVREICKDKLQTTFGNFWLKKYGLIICIDRRVSEK